MFTSDSLSIKVANHIKDKFKVYVTASVSFDCGVLSIEIFDKMFEVCSLTFEEFEVAGRSVVVRVNRWIRENFDRVRESSEVIEEEPVYFENEVESCKCLEKTGTIYNHPELRALQKTALRYWSGYAYDILGLPVISEPRSITFDVIRHYKQQCNKWAHPDKGGSSELFDMVTRAYESAHADITKLGPI